MKVITTSVICWDEDGDVTCESDCRVCEDKAEFEQVKAETRAAALDRYADNCGPLQPRNRIITTVADVPAPVDPETVLTVTLSELPDVEPIKVEVSG